LFQAEEEELNRILKKSSTVVREKLPVGKALWSLVYSGSEPSMGKGLAGTIFLNRHLSCFASDGHYP
jgi:hypothetical protein